MKRICGAKLRGKNAKCQKSPMANGKCRLHGGLTPSGTDSANFIHGKYSYALKGKLAEKFQKAKEDPSPLDLSDELHLQRAVLGQYIEDSSNKKKLRVGELFNLSMLAKDVVKTGATISKLRNDQALTIAEIKFIQKGMNLLMEKYVPDPDKRRNFIEELRRLLPGADAASEDRAAELPVVAGETSEVT